MAKDIAIFAGTFDPITNGHLDLIKRAAHLFSKVIVGVATNTRKNPNFDLETRLALNKEVLSGFANVEVKSVSGLLAHFARAEGATVLVRGLRGVADFEYELQMANMNRQLIPEVETIFLPTPQQFSFVSSSLITEIAQFGGDISAFVPKPVETALKAKFKVK